MEEDSKKSKKQEKWLKAKWFSAIDGFRRKHKDKDIRPDLERAVKYFEKSLEGEAIPSVFTLLPDDDPEQKIITVHFRPMSLNNKEITGIQKETAKSLIHKLLEINTTTKSVAQQSGLIRDRVPNSGEYAFLYSGLSPDVEILEIKFSGTGRIFGFFTQATFNIVCIRTLHINN